MSTCPQKQACDRHCRDGRREGTTVSAGAEEREPLTRSVTLQKAQLSSAPPFLEGRTREPFAWAVSQGGCQAQCGGGSLVSCCSRGVGEGSPSEGRALEQKGPDP